MSEGSGHTVLAAMDTTPAGRAEVARIEAAEARAWADLYAAAPAGWAAGAGVGTRMVDGTLVLHWAATERRYFSRAIGLGVARPATRDALDAVFEVWEELGIGMCLVQSMPGCEPAAYTEWLRERGLEPFDAQDRIVRGGEPVTDPPAPPGGRNLVVERVEARPPPSGRTSSSASITSTPGRG